METIERCPSCVHSLAASEDGRCTTAHVVHGRRYICHCANAAHTAPYGSGATAMQSEEQEAKAALDHLTSAAKKLPALDIEALANIADTWAKVNQG